MIRYSRGQITVLDRSRLEQLSCECYGVVNKETDRLLPARLPPQVEEEPQTGNLRFMPH